MHLFYAVSLIVLPRFILILFKVLEHIRDCYFEVLVLWPDKLHFLRVCWNLVVDFWKRKDYLSCSCLCFCAGTSTSGVMIIEVFLGIDSWPCLCLVGILFFGCCCLLWVPDRYGDCEVPGRECLGGSVVGDTKEWRWTIRESWEGLWERAKGTLRLPAPGSRVPREQKWNRRRGSCKQVTAGLCLQRLEWKS